MATTIDGNSSYAVNAPCRIECMRNLYIWIFSIVKVQFVWFQPNIIHTFQQGQVTVKCHEPYFFIQQAYLVELRAS